MNKVCYFLVSYFALVLTLSKENNNMKGTPDLNSDESTSVPRALVFIGRVGLKSYFASNSGRNNWSQAESYCDGLGMSLATVETNEEHDFLSMRQGGIFEMTYWVGARDRHTLKQLHWGKEKEAGREITVDMELSINPGVQLYQSCGAITPGTFGKTHLLMLKCASIYLDVGILCETKSPTQGRFLGKVGLKSYFVDNVTLAWVNADNHCQGLGPGMTLATVETDEEYDLLSGAYQPGVFDDRYWTAARDSHTRSQFVWGKTNETGTEITVEMQVAASGDVSPFLTCGAIFPQESGKALLEMLPCRISWTSGVLCELKE